MKIKADFGAAALTRVEVLIAAVTCFVVSAVILSTRCYDATKHHWISCVGNLKQIGLSYRVWAADNNDLLPMQIPQGKGGSMESALAGNVLPTFAVMSNELFTPKVLLCPADRKRAAATNFNLRAWNVSYFVGLDVTLTNSGAWLGGDRNLTNGTELRSGLMNLTADTSLGWTRELHRDRGNLLLADGSVLLTPNRALALDLRNTGFATNRISVP